MFYIKAESIAEAKRKMGDIADKFTYARSIFKPGYIVVRAIRRK